MNTYHNTLSSTDRVRLSATQKDEFVRDGFLVMRGLLPENVVAKVRADLSASLGIDTHDPATWKSVAETREWAWGAGPMTVPCRSAAVEDVIEELVGPHFLRGYSLHPFKNLVGLDAREAGFIPVLTYAEPGEPAFVQPHGWHVDGEPDHVTIPPTCLLIVFAYLTDTPAYGGATSVQPGSHRRVFEQLTRHGSLPDRTGIGMPLSGSAGDVIFMHFLLVHSSSSNFSDHVRLGLNTNALPDGAHDFAPRSGTPDETWTPFERTLRTDDLSMTS